MSPPLPCVNCHQQQLPDHSDDVGFVPSGQIPGRENPDHVAGGFAQTLRTVCHNDGRMAASNVRPLQDRIPADGCRTLPAAVCQLPHNNNYNITVRRAFRAIWTRSRARRRRTRG